MSMPAVCLAFSSGDGHWPGQSLVPALPGAHSGVHHHAKYPLPFLLAHLSTSTRFRTPPSPFRRRSADILRQYARHLEDAELLAVAAATPGMAGRDLKDVCEQAERRWASKASAGCRVCVCRAPHPTPPMHFSASGASNVLGQPVGGAQAQCASNRLDQHNQGAVQRAVHRRGRW